MEMVVLQQRAGGGGGCRAEAPMMGGAAAAAAAASAKQEEMKEGSGGGGADEVRRGPWTVDEDLTLINYIAEHGEGRWNALARAAGTYGDAPPLLPE